MASGIANALVAAALTTAPVAEPPAGRVEGIAQQDVAVFRGIPYAQPPVGPLRWRAPQSLPRWTTAFPAKYFGAVCMQADPKGDAGVGSEDPSEDCLTLNIWTPRLKRPDLPVMVWLHGGGYTGGSSSAGLYDGSALAARGIVVVTINYRLGHFGFFAHPELTRAGEGANFGLLDQRAALRWVQANISAFGGDARRVTLFGNSAGGESVLFHMTMAQSRDLFARAIVQSGLGGRNLRSASAAIDPARAATPLADLRALPAGAILGWGMLSLYRGFGPTIDDVTIKEPIEAAFRARRQARIPLIIGYNGFEIPPAAVGGTGAALALVGHDEKQRATAIAAYGSIAAYEQNAASDLLFRAPALRLARLHASTGLPTWAYAFDALASAMTGRLKGAPHASERAYVFNTLPRLGWPTDERDAEMARAIGDKWTRFAQSGRPVAQRGEWPEATASHARPLILSHDPAATAPALSPDLARYLGL